MTDIVRSIKMKCPPRKYDLDTAEGRWQWDQDLRAELTQIEPSGLRQHAGSMIKEWRWSIIEARSPLALRAPREILTEVTTDEDLDIHDEY